jgi:hypothetical protein
MFLLTLSNAGFSPDPYLSGVAMEETIIGMQSVGVQACAKHYSKSSLLFPKLNQWHHVSEDQTRGRRTY